MRKRMEPLGLERVLQVSLTWKKGKISTFPAKPTFPAKNCVSGTLQPLRAQETSFIFNMCNPDKKKRQIDVWDLLFPTSYSFCL